MHINDIETLRAYIARSSYFSETTINNVIRALGFPLEGKGETFYKLSKEFEKCAKHGAEISFSSYMYKYEKISFFRANQQDIENHMEQTAADLGTDIISMVQNFGIFRNADKPTPSEVGKALWDSGPRRPELDTLYIVFTWYALEEVARIWYGYLEDNPAEKEELSA